MVLYKQDSLKLTKALVMNVTKERKKLEAFIQDLREPAQHIIVDPSFDLDTISRCKVTTTNKWGENLLNGFKSKDFSEVCKVELNLLKMREKIIELRTELDNIYIKYNIEVQVESIGELTKEISQSKKTTKNSY